MLAVLGLVKAGRKGPGFPRSATGCHVRSSARRELGAWREAEAGTREQSQHGQQAKNVLPKRKLGVELPNPSMRKDMQDVLCSRQPNLDLSGACSCREGSVVKSNCRSLPPPSPGRSQPPTTPAPREIQHPLLPSKNTLTRTYAHINMNIHTYI